MKNKMKADQKLDLGSSCTKKIKSDDKMSREIQNVSDISSKINSLDNIS
jgi:hypothetical protein